jgi:hypothetical protein
MPSTLGAYHHAMPNNLVLHVAGATPEQLARGVAVAQAVFDEAKMSPEMAFHGFETRRAWINGGCVTPAPAEMEMEAAAAFRLAEHSAINACLDGKAWPRGCHLDLKPSLPH